MTLLVNLPFEQDYELDRLYQTEIDLHQSLLSYRHQGITTAFIGEASREWVITDLNISLRNFVITFLKNRKVNFTIEEQTEEGYVVH